MCHNLTIPVSLSVPNAEYEIRITSRMQGNPIFIEKAIALATEKIVFGRNCRFGAAIVRGGKIVAIGAPDFDDKPFAGVGKL